jgi:hypothetical protein
MDRQVEDYIHGLSDLELLEYTRTSTHLPEALEFAREELTDRHLSSDRLSDLETQLQQRARQREELALAIANEPLNWEWRIACFLCGLYLAIPFLLFVPAWHRLRDQGAERRYKEMWVCVAVGFCLQPILVLAGIPPWSWIADLF